MLMSTKKSAKIGRYLNTFTTEGFSETRPFMHLSKHRVNNFRNAGALRLIFFFFFFQNVPNLMYIPKMQ